jgi:outer membrane biosynthesis protein TonB
VIPVKVDVSQEGRVVRALADIRTTDSLRRYLAAQAQRAARSWRFKPARTKTGARVAASTTLHFVFTPLPHRKSAG